MGFVHDNSPKPAGIVLGQPRILSKSLVCRYCTIKAIVKTAVKGTPTSANLHISATTGRGASLFQLDGIVRIGRFDRRKRLPGEL